MGDSDQPSVLGSLVPHVFLPPQLPQQAQSDAEERDTSLELLRLLIDSAAKFRESVPSADRGQWQKVDRMLRQMRGFVEAPVTAESLSKALRNMNVGDVLPLHIRAQNAVVVVQKGADGSVFAVHEASPANEAVYSTTGKLLVTFPGPAVHLPTAVATNSSFLSNLSLFLSHMDVDALDALGHTRKAGSMVTEIRDTADPRYITQLLFGMLHGCEGASNADIHRHQKRVADEVMYHSALKPWRRLPLWLIIRSTLQTMLSNNDCYKAFMILFLSRCLSTCLAPEHRFPSDLLYVMRSKIARRLAKLGDSCPAFVLRAAEECAQTTQGILQIRWLAVEEDRRRQAPWAAPPSTSLAAATKLSLNNSQDFLLGVLQRNDFEHATTEYTPSYRPRFVGEQDFMRFMNDRLALAVAKETPLVALADFEACVRVNLFSWVDGLALDTIAKACECLHSCFRQYREATDKHYAKNNPHDRSLAILTLLAIWTAMDRLAVKAHPLLANYSPEIPSHFLEPLVLQGEDNRQLALDIEQHIRRRRQAVPLGAISVFETLPHSASFAAQMYAQDNSFAETRTRIEHDAQIARTNKLAELRVLNERHETLLQQLESIEHTNSTRIVRVNGESVEEEYHSSKTCQHCMLQTETDTLQIDIHEWPLPLDERSAEVVVFELTCPPAYSFWREMTHTVLTVVGRVSLESNTGSKKPERLLRAYDPLSSYATARASSITLGSATKAFIHSHYRTKNVPADESDVCVNNALQFRPYHTPSFTWISSSFPSTSTVAHLCTPGMPPDSVYAHLQFALERTTHTSNEILADQAACPQTLSIHEHLSFATMRSGGRLQWLNLARELRARTLSLSSEEVHHLIAQVIWQLGPLCDEQREWHIDLVDAAFCSRILEESSRILESVGENWKERMSVYTIVLIALRVLETCPVPSIQSEARKVLIMARGVVSSIRDSLWERLSGAKDSTLPAAQRLVCEAAAVCVSTYDAPNEHIAALFDTVDDTGSYELFRSMILVQENAPVDISQAPLHTQYLLRRHERTLHRLEGYLRTYIVADPSGLHRAVKSLWPTYHSDGSQWSSLSSPNERQIRRSFHSQGAPQLVHLDLMSGTLLVNGKPLGRLPTNIIRHPIFRRVFGQTILEVVPAADPGMQYETRGAIFGWTVAFALHPSKNVLTVRARLTNASDVSESTSTLQLIPHTVFEAKSENDENDLPHFLINEHVHWMDLDTGTIDFRPMHSRWVDDPENWRLTGIREGRPVLQRGRSPVRLVDVRGPVFHAVHACLGVLELATFIVATYDEERLRADLPRLRLSFHMNDAGELESLNYRDMIVDPDQAAHGTFFGLLNQLVLKNKGHDAQSLPRSRRVLVPDGQVHYEYPKNAPHVSVTITLHDNTERVLYHEFIVDDDLGRLLVTSSMASRLFQCLLHAVTSGCLRDPLTGQTGTEQALKELNGARMFSFRALASRDLELLRDIASLTPERTFYPDHLRVMQQVDWKDLPPLSQHAGFKPAVDAIVSYGRDLDIFIPHASSQPVSNSSLASAGRDPALLERAARRSSPHHPPDTPFSPQVQRITDDHLHHARHTADLKTYAAAEQLVARNSQILQSPSDCLAHSDMDIMGVFEPLKMVGGRSLLSLSYSPHWLRTRTIGEEWPSLYRLCTEYNDKNGLNRYQLLFIFLPFIFGKPEVEPLMKLLLALCLNNHIRSERPAWLLTTPGPIYNLKDGVQPQRSTVNVHIRRLVRRPIDTPVRNLERLPDESKRAFANRKHQEYETRTNHAVQLLVSHFMGQWPAIDLSLQGLPAGPDAPGVWVNIETQSLDALRTYFRSCSHNVRFADHVHRVESALRSQMAQDHSNPPLATLSITDGAATSPFAYTSTLLDLLNTREPPEAGHVYLTLELQIQTHLQATSQPDYQPLHSLLARLQRHDGGDALHAYLPSLSESLAHLEQQTVASQSMSLSDTAHLEVLRQDRNSHRQYMRESFERLRDALSPRNSQEQQLDVSGGWPRVTPCNLLRLLCRARYDALSPLWRRALVNHGRVVLAYQRSQRLFNFSLRDRPEEVLREMGNNVYGEAVADLQPDWLLIQIEADFLSRPLQRSIANEMTIPSSGENSLLQLNMGEGKSSVIVPFAVAALANGEALVRVVVLKALSNQMFDILVDRLGGLADRRVFYLPFSRDVPMSSDVVEKIKGLYEQCARLRGVLVVQPEHMLSFRLTSHESLMFASSNEQTTLAKSIWKLQDWVTVHSRDVLDESDELLHARYQLLYTVGQPKPVDDHPHRWTTIQQVLSVLSTCVERLQKQYPFAISFRPGPRSKSAFPHIRLLTSEVDDELRNDMIHNILDGGLPNLLFTTLSSTVRQECANFIGHHSPDAEAYAKLRFELHESSLWSGVLLLRGLLAANAGVLFYILRERRWRVDFGLDPARTLMAVPYRAKDVPSIKAEFGHPDVAITLTCLCYYYGGLTAAQVVQCFSRLFALDDPQREYGEWVGTGGSDIPVSIRELSAVNIEDDDHIETVLFPTFSFNRTAVNFYLAHVVFPREAREFPQKLGTSAWDLAEAKPQVTTGFSGTKDNRFLLPSSICQSDIPEQRATDAMVLSYMLQRENQYAAYTGSQSGEGYLQFIVSQSNEVRVLLDVGAQMLDMSNRDLAARWLTLCNNEIQAAIFFTDADDLAILTRDGVVEHFRTSSHGERLDRCIVYLDDAHTRGTDLKLPSTYRAAVTLGQKVTKDRLVQGAMRMRRLGHGQSLLLLAPREIDSAIRFVGKLSEDAAVSVSDVLQWAMLETCADITRHLPHWAAQGVDYKSRRQADVQFTQTSNLSIVQRSWMQPEARSLEQMYGLSLTPQGQELWKRVREHNDIATRLSKLGVGELGSARLSEEQEREVVLEVEREQQVQRPRKVKAATEPIQVHEDVLVFVQSGHIPFDSTQFVGLFDPLKQAGDNWDRRLLSTRDFIATVASSDASMLPALHEYMRPVAWVLSSGILGSPDDIQLVAISPYEANELLPSIRSGSSRVHLHVFSPRPFKNRSTLSDLRFHSIPSIHTPAWSAPPLLRSQLSLWAGELWLDSHVSYKQLCTFLCLYMGLSANDVKRLREGNHISGDGFVRHSGRAVVKDITTDLLGFHGSPVDRLRKLFALRRKGVPYLSTHMGRVLNARELTAAEWEA